MVQRRSSTAVEVPPVGVWPPDDTEESVVGTNIQQATITNLRTGLNEVAGGLAAEGEPPAWYALSQTGLSGLRRPDGSAYEELARKDREIAELRRQLEGRPQA